MLALCYDKSAFISISCGSVDWGDCGALIARFSIQSLVIQSFIHFIDKDINATMSGSLWQCATVNLTTGDDTSFVHLRQFFKNFFVRQRNKQVPRQKNSNKYQIVSYDNI